MSFSANDIVLCFASETSRWHSPLASITEDTTRGFSISGGSRTWAGDPDTVLLEKHARKLRKRLWRTINPDRALETSLRNQFDQRARRALIGQCQQCSEPVATKSNGKPATRCTRHLEKIRLKAAGLL